MATRMNLPRLGGAIRFAVVLVAVNLAAIALFSGGPAPTFASFSVVASLYFLDFDGTIRERFGAYAVSTLFGIAGIVIGLAVAGNIVAVCMTALVVGFVFAAARAFRGFIARAFVGVQLAFVLTVVTAHPQAHAAELVIAWVFGAAVSLVAALVLFPRHHSGVLRRALSHWCAAAAQLARAVANAESIDLTSIAAAYQELESVDRTHAIAGLWSPRTRALAEMNRGAQQLTTYFSERPSSRVHSLADRELFAQIAEALQCASQTVLPNSAAIESVDMIRARHEHTDAVIALAQAQPGPDAVDRAADAIDARVASFAAEGLQYLAAVSRGARQTNKVTPTDSSSIAMRSRSVFQANSVWLFNGIRTGIALAAALLIAHVMGLEHGVWVVMATLSLISITQTSRGTTSNALTTMIAVTLGVLISVVLLQLHLPWVGMVCVVLLAAFTAKWFFFNSVFAGQMSYTPFAILNVAMLSWPTPSGLAEVRLEDIAVGLLVAVGATLLAFPFGMKRLLGTAWNDASTVIDESIATSNYEWARGALDSSSVRNQATIAIDLYADAVDSVQVDRSSKNPVGTLCTHRDEWLALTEFYLSGVEAFELRRNGRALPSELQTALNSVSVHTGGAIDAIKRASHTDDFEALVLASWAATGLDILYETLPQTVSAS